MMRNNDSPQGSANIRLDMIILTAWFCALAGMTVFLGTLGEMPGQNDPILSWILGIILNIFAVRCVDKTFYGGVAFS